MSLIKQRGYDIWKFKRPNYQKNSGEYAPTLEKLEESGVIHDVESLREKLSKELGFFVNHSAINGIPGKSNGEYGFIVKSNSSPHTLAVYVSFSQMACSH